MSRSFGPQLKEYAEEKLPTDVKDAVIERWRAIVNEIQVRATRQVSLRDPEIREQR